MSGAEMRAAVFADVGRLAIEPRPVPRVARPDDVLVRVSACGVCGSDLQILADPPGHPAASGVVLGHEFTGEVAEAGPEVDLRPGQHVVVAPNVACGHCAWCRRGLPMQCTNYTAHGIFRDGGLAPFAVVPASNVHPIADHVPPHLAALVEPLSTVVNGVRLAQPFPGEVAAVVGAGPAGLMFCALLAAAGMRVVAVEPTPGRAALASTMGAERVVAPDAAEEAVRAASDGLGADVVVDAVGSQLAAALDLVRKGGRIVLFGVDATSRTEVVQERITRDELTIRGSFVGRDVFPDAIRIVETGRPDLAPLVTHRVGVDELPEMLDELRAGRAIKVQVEWP